MKFSISLFFLKNILELSIIHSFDKIYNSFMVFSTNFSKSLTAIFGLMNSELLQNKKLFQEHPGKSLDIV